MTPCALHAASVSDLPFLWECLTIAAHEPFVARVQAQPALARYLQNWMRPGDFGVVARRDGVDLGAAWLRQFKTEEQPYVWVAADVPELSIAVSPGQQGQGVGQALLNALAVEARSRNLRGLCLNVRDDNPAIRLYQRVGFTRLPGSAIRNRVGGTSFGMFLAL